jgi:hypothetical protein
MPLSRLDGCLREVRFWHETDVPNQASHVRYQGMNRPTLGRALTSEID